MRRFIKVSSICLVTATVAYAPVTATAKNTTATNATPATVKTYNELYAKVVHKFGIRTAGCKLIGKNATCHHTANKARVVKSIGVLRRMLAPPPPPPAPVPQAPVATPTNVYPQATVAPTTVSYTSSGYSIPSSIVQCESGGNWGAVNPSSGAGGAYQILPSTWAAYGGTGAPQNASPAEQSAIAAKIYASQGPGAWVCK